VYNKETLFCRAVYSIDISKDNNVKMVSDPIFARLTDIRVFEERLPLTRKLALPVTVVYPYPTIRYGVVLKSSFLNRCLVNTMFV